MFGAGTACVICPVKDILYENEVFYICFLTILVYNTSWSDREYKKPGTSYTEKKSICSLLSLIFLNETCWNLWSHLYFLCYSWRKSRTFDVNTRRGNWKKIIVDNGKVCQNVSSFGFVPSPFVKNIRSNFVRKSMYSLTNKRDRF